MKYRNIVHQMERYSILLVCYCAILILRKQKEGLRNLNYFSHLYYVFLEILARDRERKEQFYEKENNSGYSGFGDADSFSERLWKFRRRKRRR